MKQTLLESKTQQKHQSKPQKDKKQITSKPKLFLPNIQNKEKVSTKFLTKPKSK